MQLHVHGLSDVGRERAQNEDSLRYEQRPGLDVLVVCDGMGGHEAGEVASAVATARLVEQLCGGAPTREALIRANEAVLVESQDRRTPTMGTTAVCARLQEGSLEVGWVGDSRFYLFRNGTIVARSVDHSRVQKLIELGLITPEQARNHPDSHVLLQALGGGMGAQEAFDPSELVVKKLERGDTLLLCSDGLYDLVEDKAIYPLMAGKRPADACRALIDEANRQGGYDNISVIVACVDVPQVPAVAASGPSRSAMVSLALILLLCAVTAWRVMSPPAVDGAGSAESIAMDCSAAPAGMVCVPGGNSVVRGPSCSDPGDPNEVFVESFMIDLTEVTNEAYQSWCQDDCTCDQSQAPDHADPDQPAIGVPLERARAYCKAKGKRLLRAQEFERAAQRNVDGPVTCEEAVVANEDGPACGASSLSSTSRGRPEAVAGRAPSRYGAYDLLGNAPEWVESGLSMGGDWASDGSCLGAADGSAMGLTGFRCAAEVGAEVKAPETPPKLPRVLTEPLAPEAWTEPVAGSWGASDPAYGSGDGYPGPQQARDTIWELHRAHPDTTEVIHLADSHQGRPILALHIASGPDRDKPSVLLDGAHDGNDLLTVDYALDAARWVLESKELLAERARSRLDVWVVPMVNPDGIFTTLHLNAQRGRKNGREVVLDCRFDPATEGVDLDRNYPFLWGSLGERGSSSSPHKSTYRGPVKASEPETRAIMALNNEHRFVAAFSYHTGIGGRLVPPYTIPGLDNPEPSMAWLIGRRVARRQRFIVQRPRQPADGTEQDWHYHEHGTLAFTVLGSDHNPISQTIRAASRRNASYLLPRLVTEILDGLRIDGRVLDKDGEPVPAVISLVEQQQREGEQWTARARDGRFYRFVPEPGTYRVIAEWQGQRTEASVMVSTGAAEVVLQF